MGEQTVVVTPGEEVVLTLPPSVQDNVIIDIVEMAKKCELAAYNEGKENGTESMRAAIQQRVDPLVLRIKQLEQHNEMLSDKVESLLTGDPNGND